ncbi:hypothetical protein RSAG8_08167, partial [Rhizoctonia solani AG-8 WAC10335]
MTYSPDRVTATKLINRVIETRRLVAVEFPAGLTQSGRWRMYEPTVFFPRGVMAG